MAVSYPRDRIETVLAGIELPPSYRIIPRCYLDTPLGTAPGDSRFCAREDGFTVLYATPDFATAFIETVVRDTIRLFLACVRERYDVADVLLFGSRARHEANPESDTDLAVLLRGEPGKRLDVALDMAGIAFDVMLKTGVLVDALPLWEDEWTHPERFSNPTLIENIRQDGIRL